MAAAAEASARRRSSMQVRAGSLLIAHPANAHPRRANQVTLITESNSYSTTGLILNLLSNLDLRKMLLEQDIDWYGDNRLYIGGDNNPNAMVMLHSDEWYSSNTMQIDRNLSMSSDRLMMEKLEMGNEPEWYKLFAGFEAWDSDDLEYQLKSNKPEWLLLSRPSQALIELADDHLWQTAVEEYSQDVFSNYI